MKRSTPLEFLKVLVSPVILITFLLTVSCKIQDPIYVVRGLEMHVLYENRKGDLIEVPINSDECIGYSKPYHTTSFNK